MCSASTVTIIIRGLGAQIATVAIAPLVVAPPAVVAVVAVRVRVIPALTRIRGWFVAVVGVMILRLYLFVRRAGRYGFLYVLMDVRMTFLLFFFCWNGISRLSDSRLRIFLGLR